MNLTITLLENKLSFSKEAIDFLNVSAGDRIAVNYVQVTNKESFPVVGKSDAFVDPNAGNKLTKSNTVSFRGMQHTMLSQYGVEFTIELFKNKMYKLIKIK